MHAGVLFSSTFLFFTVAVIAASTTQRLLFIAFSVTAGFAIRVATPRAGGNIVSFFEPLTC